MTPALRAAIIARVAEVLAEDIEAIEALAYGLAYSAGGETHPLPLCHDDEGGDE